MHTCAHRLVSPAPAPRQYTRALTAVKLDKMFAKPFIGALEGHTDSVWSMTPSRHSLVRVRVCARAAVQPCAPDGISHPQVPFLTGSCDGEIRLWDLPHQRTLWSCYAHSGFVRGLTVSHDGAHFFSCGDDKTIKQFPLTLDESRASKGRDDDPEPLNTWMSKHVFTCVCGRARALPGLPHGRIVLRGRAVARIVMWLGVAQRH